MSLLFGSGPARLPTAGLGWLPAHRPGREITNSDSRQSRVRRDDDNFRATVQTARDNIYRGGYALGSGPGVERFLKEESLVPTLVCHSIQHIYDLISTPERILPLPEKLQL